MFRDLHQQSAKADSFVRYLSNEDVDNVWKTVLKLNSNITTQFTGKCC